MTTLQQPKALSNEAGLALTAVLLAMMLPVFAFLRDDIASDLAALVFLMLYVLMAAIDITTYKVPNILVYPAIVFALMSTAIINVELLPEALAGGGAGLLLMFVIALIGRGAMGMGDVKVGCFTGCVHGVASGVLALGIGFSLGFFISLPILLLRLRDRKDRLPLTPFLATGAIVIWAYTGFLLTR